MARKQPKADGYVAVLDRSSSEYSPFIDPDVTVIRHTPGGDTYHVKHKGKRLGSLCWRRVRERSPGRERCTRPAGWGTQHVGTGACRFHGGGNNKYATISGSDYGQYLTDEYAGRFRSFVEMEEPKSLNNELALLRVLLSTLVDRPEFDTKEVRDTLESVGRMVDRMERLDMATNLTQVQVQLLVVHMVALIKQHVVDKDQRVAFATDFLKVFGLTPNEDGLLQPGSVSDDRVIELARERYHMEVV